ncbi:MAG: endonuclease/exonuclease/phosphatase family protein, partial [Armatimonadetes bacterium]|nr:endonuclease/exonuclease/phosphatase family protein [Anaerolineae bacterium]
LIAGAALVLAQFCVSLMWWWLTRRQAERERNVSGLWLVFSGLVFAVFVGFDLFTYEYAYVRDFAAPLRFLNSVVPPLLRGFRGFGLIVLLLAVVLAALPMVQTRKRIPWANAPFLQTIGGLLVVIAAAIGTAYAARPLIVTPVREVAALRVATYNIHAGRNEFFYHDLEALAQTIERSGADVVLLQEVDAGRLTSFSVDQPLWLARRLQMDTRFFATNEGLQGLAVLSKVPIVFDDGALLTSIGSQTGLQRVQVRPDDSVITVYNTWLGLLVGGVGDTLEAQESDQQNQLTEILGIIALHHQGGTLGRTVVGGTFNNIPDSDLAQRMRDLGFADPFADLPPVLSDTFWQTTRRARLDYLWLVNLPGLQAIALDSAASDHRLAVVEVAITR